MKSKRCEMLVAKEILKESEERQKELRRKANLLLDEKKRIEKAVYDLKDKARREEDDGIHKALEYILEYSENASIREFIKPMLDKRPTVKYAKLLTSVGLEDLDVGVKIPTTTLKKLDYYRARTVVYYIDGLMRDSLEITIDEDNIITHIERRVRG
jgi:hypothetical protein